MGAFSLQKGKKGEREVKNILNQWFCNHTNKTIRQDVRVSRNLAQAEAGGYDLIGIDWAAIEVKLYTKVTSSLVARWWSQTLKNAGQDQMPILFYRQNRGKWNVRTIFRAAALDSHFIPYTLVTVDVEINEFKCYFLRNVEARL
jgi:hypothetical protein